MIDLTYDESLAYFLKTHLSNKKQLVDDTIRTRIEQAVTLINKNINIKHKVQKHAISHTDNGVMVSHSSVILTGKDIANHLLECSDIYVFVVTLGHEIDRLIRRYQISDMSMSYYIDTLSSYLVEKCCTVINHDIIGGSTLPVTSRYSCGYGDFPLATQKDLLMLLDAEKFCGIVLTAGNMMIPAKSVTAVIGQGTNNYINRCSICKVKQHCNGECHD